MIELAWKYSTLLIKLQQFNATVNLVKINHISEDWTADVLTEISR